MCREVEANAEAISNELLKLLERNIPDVGLILLGCCPRS